MAVSAIGGVSSTVQAAPGGSTAPADGERRADPTANDSQIVISKVTKTNPDGSTTTTITYADGHAKVETTPAKFAATEGGESRVTAVDILA